MHTTLPLKEGDMPKHAERFLEGQRTVIRQPAARSVPDLTPPWFWKSWDQ